MYLPKGEVRLFDSGFNLGPYHLYRIEVWVIGWQPQHFVSIATDELVYGVDGCRLVCTGKLEQFSTKHLGSKRDVLLS